MNRLKQITTKAKALYKTGKYKKWTDAIKQASKSLGSHTDTKSHNVNVRVVSGVKKKRKKVGAIKILQKGESKNAKVTKTLMQTRGKKGHFKGYKKISGVHEYDNPSGKKMMVRISPVGYVYASKFITQSNKGLREWLQNNVGKWIEIDTKFMFDTQYNTKDGYRIYDTMIDAIKNDVRKQKDFTDDVAFLDWSGIKPVIINLPEQKFGSYYFESYPSLNYHRLHNARQTINFLYYNGYYYQTNGIGYKKYKSISGQWSGNTIPSDVKKKVDKLMKSHYS